MRSELSLLLDSRFLQPSRIALIALDLQSLLSDPQLTDILFQFVKECCRFNEVLQTLDHSSVWRFMKYSQQVPHKYGEVEEFMHDTQGRYS